MNGILAQLLIKLGLDSKEFEKGVDGAKQKTNHFADGIKRIGGIIAGAFAVSSVSNFAKELIKLGGEAEGVRAAFNKIATGTDLQNMKDSVRGTVSELNLMKRAVQAENLGIPVKNLSSLFEFATKRAQDTGQSVDYLVDSIVLGIGRKSPLILDNLGISAVALKEKLKGTGTETASVADIAKAVGEIAADSMRKSGEIIDTNSIKIQNLTAQWEDFKLSVAESPGFNKFVSKELAELQKNLNVFFSEDISGWEKFLAFTDVTGKNIDALNRKLLEGEKIKQMNDENRDSYIAYMQSLAKSTDEQITHVKTVKELIEETDNLKESIGLYNINQTAEINKTLHQIAANEKLIDSLTKLKEKRDTAMPGGDFMIKPVTELPKIGNNLSEMAASQDTGITKKYGGSELLGTNVSELDKLNKYAADKLKEGNALQKELLDERLNTWNNFRNDMGSMVADFGVDVVEQFGESMGEMLATGEFPADFGQNILAGIGGFLVNLGKMMIQFGIASEAFQNLLKNIEMPGAPFLLIAAGAALVLLGGAIKGAAKAGPSGAGGGGGSISSPSYSKASSGGSGMRAQDNKVVFEIKGDKLVGVLANTGRKNSNIG